MRHVSLLLLLAGALWLAVAGWSHRGSDALPREKVPEVASYEEMFPQTTPMATSSTLVVTGSMFITGPQTWVAVQPTFATSGTYTGYVGSR